MNKHRCVYGYSVVSEKSHLLKANTDELAKSHTEKCGKAQY